MPGMMLILAYIEQNECQDCIYLGNQMRRTLKKRFQRYSWNNTQEHATIVTELDMLAHNQAAQLRRHIAENHPEGLV